MGCAYSNSCTWSTYICQYSPPGNVIDADWATEVLPLSNGSTAGQYSSWTPASGPSEPYQPILLAPSAMPAEVPVPTAPASEVFGTGGMQSPAAGPSPQQQSTYIPFGHPYDNTKGGVSQQPSSANIPAMQQPTGNGQGQQQSATPAAPAWQTPASLSWPAARTPASWDPTFIPANMQQPAGATPAATLGWGTDSTPAALAWGTGGTGSTPSVPSRTPRSTGTAPTAPARPAAGMSGVPAAFAGVVRTTNAYRHRHQVPALKWDPALAAQAQRFADSCPMGHSGAQGLGENVAWGYPDWKSTVDAWYNEVQQYNFNNPGWSGSTGHFTQLVWKGTTKMGCGQNKMCSMVTYVCNYKAAGNMLGLNWSAQVLPARG
eukprot:GHRR01015756.1.p1 GENE.GHRR01015756.1~~GHRR01015756.1.p1  ORF type:complete len:375 (+),score=118.02 GHRR01015756.1:504-1628(+)